MLRSLLVPLVLLTALLGGCIGDPSALGDGDSEPPARPTNDATPAPPRDAPPTPEPVTTKLVIGGTGLAMPLALGLAAAYEAKNPGVSVTVITSLGSSGGIKAVLADEIDLAFTARKVKDEEKAAGAVSAPFLREALAFMAHESAGVSDLTYEQVLAIYEKRITNWKDVGGNDVPIVLASREPEDSVAKTVFKAYPALKNLTTPEQVSIITSDMRLFSTTGSTQGAVAFASLHAFALLELPVHPIHVDGHVPDAANVADGTYPLVLDVGLVSGPTLSPEAAAFRDFLLGDEARDHVKAKGYVVG